MQEIKNWSEQLTRIYNALFSINTKGEDTLMMSDCLRAIEQIVVAMNRTNDNNTSVSTEEE